MTYPSKRIIETEIFIELFMIKYLEEIFDNDTWRFVYRTILIKNLFIMASIFSKSLSAKQAKNNVFEHWKDLEAFAKRRFPDDENQANQSLDYALEQLQADEWMRVRQWQGKGRFLTFLLTLTANLITDYTRKQFGHHRPPKWLLDKSDILWNKAYRLLVVEHYNRHEAIEILKAQSQEISLITAVVEEILEKCQIKNQPPKFASEDEFEQLGSLETEPSRVLKLTANDLIEILLKFLTSNDEYQLPKHLEEHISSLQSSIVLNEEDRMLLYLRFVEGMSMNEIVKVLKFEGNPYKRINKLIEKLQETCDLAGLIPDEIDEEK